MIKKKEREQETFSNEQKNTREKKKRLRSSLKEQITFNSSEACFLTFWKIITKIKRKKNNNKKRREQTNKKKEKIRRESFVCNTKFRGKGEKRRTRD